MTQRFKVTHEKKRTKVRLGELRSSSRRGWGASGHNGQHVISVAERAPRHATGCWWWTRGLVVPLIRSWTRGQGARAPERQSAEARGAVNLQDTYMALPGRGAASLPRLATKRKILDRQRPAPASILVLLRMHSVQVADLPTCLWMHWGCSGCRL